MRSKRLWVFWSALQFFLFLTALACNSRCSSGDASDAQVQQDACLHAFSDVLTSWDDLVGRAPDECRDLAADYAVVLVAAQRDLASLCDEHNVGVNQVLAGCTQPSQKTIYLLDGRSNADTADSAVHEWIHALSRCARGDIDRDHVQPKLWTGYEKPTVEDQALSTRAEGECLH